MVIQTVAKKSASNRNLGYQRGVFPVPIVSLIFEKILEDRITLINVVDHAKLLVQKLCDKLL